MIHLGEKQRLIVVKEVEFGIYLAPEEAAAVAGTIKNKEQPSAEKVLLPGKQKPEGISIGDPLEVFVYKDSGDRLIATTREPLITLGQVARLRVAQVGKIGAFLEWGLEKDLLLPFREQTRRVQEGEMCNVALYIDKSQRLCATMKIYHYLAADSPYRKDDEVSGEIYEISTNFGAFVAVDHRYSGLIPRKEMYGELRPGDMIQARITEVKADGKLDLSLRQKAWQQIGTDAAAVLEAIKQHGGALPFNDKAAPEVIRSKMQMSKNEFKRAVGNLLKAGKIKITEHSIVMIESDK